MGLVIRCLFNNQHWKDACIKPGDDWECKLCFTSPVNIKSPKANDEVCSGDCWERYLCRNYRWGCTPQGRTFAQAHKGMRVFFAYKHFMGDYTIWATTKVKEIDSSPMHTRIDGEEGFAFIHFEPFEPLPREKWVSDLSDQKLVGEMWRQGRFRYIDKDKEKYFDQLIQGVVKIEDASNSILGNPSKDNLVSFELKPNIKKRIDQYAQQEGRTIEEILRESIAEWLRVREK